MTAQFLPFVFCFIRELNPLLAPYLLPLPPRALSLWLNRVKDSTNLYPPLTLTLRPPIRPKARGFIKPLVLTLNQPFKICLFRTKQPFKICLFRTKRCFEGRVNKKRRVQDVEVEDV